LTIQAEVIIVKLISMTMKTLIRFLLLFTGISLLNACSESDIFWVNIPVMQTELLIDSIPFKADYIGNYIFKGEDLAKCGKNNLRIIVQGKGTGTFLGNSTIYIDFCRYIECYGPAVFYLIADLGDTLYVSGQGRVVEGRSENHPSYVTSYWRDPFVISGGTGRFKGASGGGMTDDYTTSIDNNAHYHWKGIIKLAIKQKYNLLLLPSGD
jgi:hypothetical protein